MGVTRATDAAGTARPSSPPETESPPSATAPSRIRWAWLGLSVILVFWVGLLGIRLHAPNDLMDDDQERPATYVLDCVENAHWAIQYDASGDIAAKPPLAVWLSAGAVHAWGASRLGLLLPSGLAVLAIALLLYQGGGVFWGWRTGLFAALAWLSTQSAWKALGLLRTDPVFSAWICAGGLACLLACLRGRGWLWVFLCAAAATLSKGPLGLVLVLAGLPACLGHRRWRADLRFGVGFTVGLCLYLVIVAVWFWSALQAGGQAVLDKLLWDELVGHALSGDAGEAPLSGAWKPPLFLVARLLPWTPLVLLGTWLAWRRPAGDGDRRRAERFLLVWVGLGLLLFAMPGHQRNLLILPLVPLALLLACRPAADWLGRRRPTGLGVLALLLLGTGWLGCHLYYGRWRAAHPEVVDTAAASRLAKRLALDPGLDAPLSYSIAPLAVSCLQGRYRRIFVPTIAQDLLRSDAAVWIVTSNPEGLQAGLRADGVPTHVLLREPLEINGVDVGMGVIANVPDFRPRTDSIYCAAVYAVETRGLPLLAVAGDLIRCGRPRPGARVYLGNTSLEAGIRRLVLVAGERRWRFRLQPGEKLYLRWAGDDWQAIPHDEMRGPWRVDVRRALRGAPIKIEPSTVDDRQP